MSSNNLYNENDNTNDDNYIIFLKIFLSLLESCPSVKVQNAKVINIKKEMIETARSFNEFYPQ
jgi:hypothetical protein